MKEVGIYVHIPFCKSRCFYCDFSSCTDFSLQERYFSALKREIELTENSGATVSTVFIGGGTPTTATTKQLDELFDTLDKKFCLSTAKEITVECNPESLSEEKIVCLKNNGVNRLSIGLQSANDKTLSAVGRIHTKKDFERALETSIRHGFFNVNADLIIGLPESKESFCSTVGYVSSLPLTHVSMYGLELHENTKLYDVAKQKGNFFSDDELADMYDFGKKVLEDNGFLRYEVSNFAKKGFESKHNLGYWKEKRYYGFGLSSHGFIGNVRYSNADSFADYFAKVENGLLPVADKVVLIQSDEKYEYVMLGMRLSDGIDICEYGEKFGSDFFADFVNARRLANQGFLCVSDNHVFVAKDKFYVLNSILTELLQ